MDRSEQVRAYYVAHRVEICARARARYLEQRSERGEYDRVRSLVYYRAHRDEVNARKRARRAEKMS